MDENMDSRALLSDNADLDGTEVRSGGCYRTLCDPTRRVHRFIVLIFMCFLGFGSYFCYDTPGPLQEQIETDMGVSTSQFSSLYAWYSWPNTVLCFFGGFLIDRVFGIRLGAIIFSLFILAGQMVFALGGIVNKFWVMQLGRFIFGVGGESLAVAQNTYAVSWFKGKELNMVFGLQLSISRVGSAVNFNTMLAIYNAVSTWYQGHTQLGVALMIAAVMCVFSQFCAVILALLDKRAERILRKAEAQSGEVVRITDVKDFPLSFWLLSIICVAFYVTIFPFVGLGTLFFQRKFEFNAGNADLVDSIVYTISAFASPVLGILVDLVGRNVIWVIVAVVATLGCHALLAFSFINPWVAMVTMGLTYSLLACALWPMVAMVIAEHQLGTAYGIMQSVQNLGLAVITMVAGMIVDAKGYLVLEVFFCAWLCVALLASILLLFFDAKKGGFLNMSVKQRTEMDQMPVL